MGRDTRTEDAAMPFAGHRALLEGVGLAVPVCEEEGVPVWVGVWVGVGLMHSTGGGALQGAAASAAMSAGDRATSYRPSSPIRPPQRSPPPELPPFQPMRTAPLAVFQASDAVATSCPSWYRRAVAPS